MAEGINDVAYPEGVIHICPNCRLQWAERSASAIEGDVDVTGMHGRYMDPRSIDGPAYPPYRDFFRRIGNRFGDRPLSILDVGCGNGVFLAEAARRGHRVRGIELDTRHRAVIPEALRERVVFAAAEEALPALSESYDVVTFWDSFEHIDDPFALLPILRPHLAAGGVVFARVNNTHDLFNLLTRIVLAAGPRDLGRRLLKACFNLPQHAWNFSRPGMRSLLERRGWLVWADRITETPSSRLTASPLARLAIEGAYLANRLIGGGKIGEYYFAPADADGQA